VAPGLPDFRVLQVRSFAVKFDIQGTAAALMYDIFITHAWRYHDDWVRVSNLFDAEKSIKWRNFSVPWYDPALDPNTELGARAVRAWLDGQIRPVIGTVLLDSVYAVKSTRKWLELEVEISHGHGKPVVVIPAYGATAISDEARALADGAAAWDALGIVKMLEDLGAARRAAVPAGQAGS
jgi:hypothetical protein